jgi:LuxR family maltose regulon positive regulatory protein
LDDEGVWFRYHHLFAEMLQVRLGRIGAETTTDLHLEAARWYEQAGRVDDALYHAVQAKAYGYAAGVVQRNWRRATDDGWPNITFNWLQILSADLVQENPLLCLTYACTQWLRGLYKGEEYQYW